MRLRAIEFCRRHPGGAAAVVLLFLPLAILGHAPFHGKVLSPAENLLGDYFPWSWLAPRLRPGNPYLTDVTYSFHPWMIYAAGEIRQGRFPLWNPYDFTGAPFFANPQTAVLFPLAALAYVLPVPIALTLISSLKLSVAGAGMYWFLRVLAVTPLAALTGALAFMLSGVLVVWLQWSLATTMMLLPLLFGLTERLRQRGTHPLIAGLGVAVALDFFAGYPQGTVYELLAVTAWALARARGAAGGGWFLARYATALGLGTVLAAVQLLPFLEYFLESSILVYRSEWMPAVYVPLRALITFLMPHFYGSPTGRDFWGDWNFHYITTSVGLVPWVALPVAVVAGWRRVGTRFFLGLALLALGIHHGAPGLSALASIPVVSFGTSLQLTTPLVAVSLSTLCGLGLDAIARGECGAGRLPDMALRAWFVALVGSAFFLLATQHAARAMKVPAPAQYLWFLALLSLAALSALRWLRDPAAGPRWGLALAGLQLLSTLPLAATYNPMTEMRWFYPVPPAIQHLQARTARDRSRVLLPATTGTVYRLFEVQGRDGLTPRRIEQVVGPIGYGASAPGSWPSPAGVRGSELLHPTTVFYSPMFDLLGIRHLVVPAGAPSPRQDLSLAYDGPDARIYENARAFPRVFLVPRARCVDDVTALRLIWQQAVDFREEVLLADCEEPPSAAPRGSVSHAEIREYSGDRVVIAATTDAAAYLVLTDTWFPGWRVRVNGREQPVLRANHAFRAVRLESGRHAIEFRYRPASFQIGLGFSVLGACLAGALCLRSRRQSRALS